MGTNVFELLEEYIGAPLHDATDKIYKSLREASQSMKTDKLRHFLLVHGHLVATPFLKQEDNIVFGDVAIENDGVVDAIPSYTVNPQTEYFENECPAWQKPLVMSLSHNDKVLYLKTLSYFVASIR